MIDFQYQPSVDDRNSQLRHAMDTMDGGSQILAFSFLHYIDGIVEALRAYEIQEEDFRPLQRPTIDANIDSALLPAATSEQPPFSAPDAIETQNSLRLFPPPIFSRQTVPQGYKSVTRITV